MAGNRRKFWQRHPGLVWSNPDVDDAVWIRAALLRPNFPRLLEIAVEFGLDRLRQEWDELLAEGSPKVLRARGSVQRILVNIEKGFSRVTARH